MKPVIDFIINKNLKPILMKKIKIFAVLGIILAAPIFIAADHIDAPGVAGSTADIADFYAFEPTTGSDNTVFIVDVQSNVRLTYYRILLMVHSMKMY